MGRKYTEEERLERIEVIGKYFLDTGASTRDIAKYFTDNYFDISNKTVSLYIKEYMNSHNEKKDKIKDLIDNNTEKSIEDLETRERVLTVARLVLQGLTKEEISNELGVSVKTVERDISSRLPMICEQDEDYKIYYKAVMNSLHHNQVSTIEKNRKTFK